MRSLRSIFVVLLTTLCAGCGAGGTETTQTETVSRFDAVTTLVDSALSLPRCPAPPNPLHTITTIHGSGKASPKAGQQVTVRGVVTADFASARQLHGFFMQQVARSRNAKASEGIFVYLAARAKHVDAGQYVQISGTVEDYKSHPSDTGSLTRINNVTSVSTCGTGPAIEAKNMTLPLDSAGDFKEFESMLVRFPQALTVADNHKLGDHGELLLSANGRLWQPYNHPVLTDPDAINDLNVRSQILLDDGSTSVNPNPIPYLSASDDSGTRRVGDSVTGLQGILTWASNAWRLQPTQGPVFTPLNPRPDVPPEVGGNLRVASMNVLSYFTTLNQRGAHSEVELQRQRDKLVTAIAGLNADVLGLMEIENSAGVLDDLVGAVNAQLGAGTYAAIDIGAETQGSDAIKVAMIYKPAKVTPTGAAELPPTLPFEVNNVLRPPLAQRFATFDGDGFWLVVNHLKSKSRCPANSASTDRDHGQGCWNATRMRQAKALDKWVAGLVAESDQTNVLMLGDFNAYFDEDPIHAIIVAGYEDLLTRLPAAERYSYVFAGQSGALDHSFASATLSPQVSGIAFWHINADEPAVLDYSTAYKPNDRYAATPWRSSDHDPVLVGLSLGTKAGLRH